MFSIFVVRMMKKDKFRMNLEKFIFKKKILTITWSFTGTAQQTSSTQSHNTAVYYIQFRSTGVAEHRECNRGQFRAK
jgi:hypothetical protein